jgi:hypothetical protein
MGSQPVHRTANTGRPTIENMSIDYRGLDVTVAQEFLYRKKALISGSAISAGWRTLWKKMNRFTQCR